MFDNTEKFVNHILQMIAESKSQCLGNFTTMKYDVDNAFNVWMYHHAMSVIEEMLLIKLDRYKKGELDFD
jgi:hypothetical protein